MKDLMVVLQEIVTLRGKDLGKKINFKKLTLPTVKQKVEKTDTITLKQLQSLKLSFSPELKDFSPKSIKEFNSSPGALLNLTKEGKFHMLNTKRDKLYYKALLGYGVPQSNIYIVDGKITFKV